MSAGNKSDLRQEIVIQHVEAGGALSDAELDGAIGGNKGNGTSSTSGPKKPPKSPMDGLINAAGSAADKA